MENVPLAYILLAHFHTILFSSVLDVPRGNLVIVACQVNELWVDGAKETNAPGGGDI